MVGTAGAGAESLPGGDKCNFMQGQLPEGAADEQRLPA